MKLLNAKVALAALSIAALIGSPAFAKTPHQPNRHASQQQIMSDPAPETGRGLYNMVPGYGGGFSSYSPADTGGGSIGYNQMLHDDAW